MTEQAIKYEKPEDRPTVVLPPRISASVGEYEKRVVVTHSEPQRVRNTPDPMPAILWLSSAVISGCVTALCLI